MKYDLCVMKMRSCLVDGVGVASYKEEILTTTARYTPVSLFRLRFVEHRNFFLSNTTTPTRRITSRKPATPAKIKFTSKYGRLPPVLSAVSLVEPSTKNSKHTNNNHEEKYHVATTWLEILLVICAKLAVYTMNPTRKQIKKLQKSSRWKNSAA